VPPVVDPQFGARLRELRQRRGLSLRDLGRSAISNRTTVWEIETGRAAPTMELARRLDDALGACGRLTALVVDESALLNPDDRDRLAAVRRDPRRVDRTAVDSLAAVLTGQRRLEDAVGSAAVLVPVHAQMVAVEALADQARGRVRNSVLDVGAQWAQFAGWLSANTGQLTDARSWYLTALGWATETGDANMIATALNMRGHLAWLTAAPGPLIGLSAAAARQPASPGVLALAAQQEARGHALLGEADDVDRLLDRAVELSDTAAHHPDNEPPWIYFHSPDYLRLQRGLAYRLLGRHDEAIALLTAGLAAIPPEGRRSEWAATYMAELALTLLAMGDRSGAAGAAAEVTDIARATGSTRLVQVAARLRLRLADAG